MSNKASSSCTSRGVQTEPELTHAHVARIAVVRPRASHVRFQAARKTTAAKKNIVKRPIYEGPKPRTKHSSIARKTGMNSWELEHVVDDIPSDVVDSVSSDVVDEISSSGDDNIIRKGHNLLDWPNGLPVLPSPQEPEESSEPYWGMPEVLEFIEYVRQHPEMHRPPERQEEEEEEASEDVILIPRAPETIKICFLGRCGRLEDFYPPFRGARNMQDIEAAIEANYQAGPGNHMSPVGFATLEYFVNTVSEIFEQLEEDRMDGF